LNYIISINFLIFNQVYIKSNTMKKITTNFPVILLFILVTSGLQLHSQNFYFSAGTSYNRAAAPNLFSCTENSSFNDGSKTTYQYKSVKGSGSFGKGFQADFTAGYMFTPQIGAEISSGYLSGASLKSTESTSNYIAYSSDQETTTIGSMFRFSPAFKIIVGKGKLRPWMRTGVVIGVGTKLTEKHTSADYTDWGSHYTKSVIEYSGRLSFGFTASLGADLMFNKHLGIFTDGSIIAQSWSPKRSRFTSYTRDGIDQLPLMTTRDKETEYVDSYSYTTPITDTSSPRKELKKFFPFSSIGITVGMRFSF
jgi:hypothetical protein